MHPGKQQMQNIFDIKKLTCEYIADLPVLYINDLQIPAGKLIFIIGKSGIGKSTFIETLGLMNKTVARKEETLIQFTPVTSGSTVELKDSWSLPDTELATLRQQHFSFIFQNTNLMPNFSAGENMMTSLLIQGVSVEKARKQVYQMMNRLSLDDEVFNKKITELSGGQRQRLAFVRAVTTDFTVLFGDEPTGNLDENTADDLMGILKTLIQEEGRTCMIVSHDLRLAVKFADIIIPIASQKSAGERTIGIIDKTNIIVKANNNWVNNKGESLDKPAMYLKLFLNNAPLVSQTE